MAEAVQTIREARLRDRPVEPAIPAGDAEVSRILGISIPISVALAQRQMTIDSILAVTVGTILEFEVPSDAELTLYVGDQPIGKGQAVKVGENFGIRLARVGTVRARIDAMSPHETGEERPHPQISTSHD